MTNLHHQVETGEGGCVPLSAHIADLRRIVLRVLLIISVGFIVAFFFHDVLLDILKSPFDQIDRSEGQGVFSRQHVHWERMTNEGKVAAVYDVPIGATIGEAHDADPIGDRAFRVAPGGHVDIHVVQSVNPLVVLDPTEGMVAIVRVCFWVSVVLTAPLWLFFVVSFIFPALGGQWRRWIIGLCVALFCLACAGGSFAFLVTIPVANAYFFQFNDRLGVNLWALSPYLDYTLFLLLANPLVFELFAVLFFLVHTGHITASMMRNKRRQLCVGALILGAILTPPDVMTQVLLAVPMIILYELAILYGRLRARVTSPI